jgi:cell division septal protein FtsQ
MSIDPRLAERRRVVAEDHAHRNIRRLLRFLLLLIGLGAIVWFALSPWVSVGRVRTAGVVSSDAAAILEAHQIVVGTPMILVRTGEVEGALESDPWVIEADVALDWPNDVVVKVTERVPRAWVETAGGWVRRAEDGFPVPSGIEPDNTLGWVRLPTVTEEDAVQSDLVLGSIDFLANLPPQIAVLTAVRLEEGELWAVVDGYQVRLGRATEMRQKAISLVSLMAEGLPKTATLVLIAPTHPSVIGLVEGESDGSQAGEEEETEQSEETTPDP